ncbi:MAG TPA: hypothetical protein VG518_02755 [Solirubrobacterales bacterium]|nr:hypothetical protein [Solirubrobacterales bacterium]
MSTQSQSPAGLRASLANAAWIVEERVVWGGADLFRAAGGFFRSALDAVKWPFERALWALERAVLWPLEERLGVAWEGPLRAAGVAVLVVVAIGAGVAGLLWAAPDHGNNAAKLSVTPVVSPPISAPVQEQAPPAGPTLHGVAPDFAAPKEGGGAEAAKSQAASPSREKAPATQADTAQGTATAEAQGAPQSSEPAPGGAVQGAEGPGATEVARRFADAFVLYETGKTSNAVKAAFHATATPALARSLLRRPPRLPANVKVPRAKVLNVVLGPAHNGVSTISVSLLRVGLTSELRLDMQKDKSGDWQVTNVLG